VDYDGMPNTMIEKKIAVGASLLLPLLFLTACGGSSPLGNPPTVSNSSVQNNQALSFAYFQRCINPIFEAQLQTQLNGSTVTNTCAAAGCHASATGAGGALRIVPTAAVIDVTSAVNTAATIRTTDMYKNFYSAQGEVVIAAPLLSKLLNKPMLRETLHGGGLIFTSTSDPHVQLITYWINNPAPIGQDEFSTSTYDMFTPADPMSGTCKTQ
jgi:hypothetical protein